MLDINTIFENGYKFLIENKDKFEEEDKNKIEELKIAINLLGLNPIRE